MHPQSFVFSSPVGIGADGTHTALSAFFTTSFFISDDVMIDLDARLTWQMEWTTSFDKLVVVAKLELLLSGPLSEV